MAEISDSNAQEVVNDLNAAYYYLPEDLQPSTYKTIRFIAEHFNVIDDDTELHAAMAALAKGAGG